MATPPFDSPQGLRAAFTAGLESLLEDEGLGAYILVLANAGFDPEIHARLGGRLEQCYRLHAERIRGLLAQGRESADAPDDLLVFLKLMALEGGNPGATEVRRVGPWELQFNLLRAFRPKRMSASPAPGLLAPFRSEGFHFNRPFLRRETLWQGELLGEGVDLLYNKFPFVELHLLLVPEREACLSQYLYRHWHHYVWRLAGELGERLPGVGFGYNSYGAFASVNHLHFQMFVRACPLPLLDPLWRHNGGRQDYPAVCEVFTRVDEAWDFLERLHHRETPYNLVYLPGRLFCLPRARQGSYRHAPWAGGHAWHEMAGGALTFRRSDFEALDAAAIAAELSLVGRPG